MPITIRELVSADVEAVVAFSLRAWAPVFASFDQVLGPEIYKQVYPDSLAGQARAVEAVCRNEAASVTVAELASRPVGFAAIIFHDEPRSGEIDMVAVDPDHQRRGVGNALMSFAMDQMRDAGFDLAIVSTGGDPGHAPARGTYEKAGFTPLPLVKYYKTL